VATVPHCVARLEDSGALANLRRAAGLGSADDAEPADHIGYWFSDTDVYKTAEAVAWELGRAPDNPALGEFLAATAALLAKAQLADGYLNSYYQATKPERRWQELRSSHELYCAGHLIQAAVAVGRSGVCPELLGIARRFADLLVERFGPEG